VYFAWQDTLIEQSWIAIRSVYESAKDQDILINTLTEQSNKLKHF